MCGKATECTNCNNLKISWFNPADGSVGSSPVRTNTPIITAEKKMMNFSFQFVQHHESADRATGDTCGPIRPAVQKGMWLLWKRSVARPVLQVLEGGVPAGTAETDPGRLGLGRKVRPSGAWIHSPSGLKRIKILPSCLSQHRHLSAQDEPVLWGATFPLLNKQVGKCVSDRSVLQRFCDSSGCKERRRQRMPAVMERRHSLTLSPQPHKRTWHTPRWDPSPSLRRRKPTRRRGKWRLWRSSSALHHALLPRKVRQINK